MDTGGRRGWTGGGEGWKPARYCSENSQPAGVSWRTRELRARAGDNLGGGMERELGGRFGVGGHMCTHGRVMMLYGRGHHDIVESLSSS